MDQVRGSNLYESYEMKQVTGETIRPGGFSLTERAADICKFAKGANVLDVGCGVGSTVQYLRYQYGLSAVGVDPSPLQLADGLSKNRDLPIFQGQGEALPFEHESMEGIFAECTLSLMDPSLALPEFYRVLKPNGYLIVSDIYARNEDGVSSLRNLNVASCLTGAVSRKVLTDRLQESGFEVVLWEDHSRLLAELTARLIFANESAGSFWGLVCGTGLCTDTKGAVNTSRPGYFLLIARKTNGNTHGNTNGNTHGNTNGNTHGTTDGNTHGTTDGTTDGRE
ncbi:DVU_1556 family methyltransferase [Alicyclobacillus sp. SO9]|uniref:DVU_1556 family methyltransferase n=1 Tax=Alicyclobacillus sp. SO9 TaxID=2665646 RepID=UPI0018E83D50|nr:class I SAM-dependent methyltransferase [Alicyclobacillus sp. SO9]QQE80590.1 class I SAM-dependent methyltransferase [Alicyclobacillus sp. SO9]